MKSKRKQIACTDCGEPTSNISVCDACLRKFMEWAQRAEKRLAAPSPENK